MAKRKQPTKREVAEENKSAWTRFFRETKMEMRKSIQDTAKLLLINAKLYEEEKGKEVSRHRISSHTLKRISKRQALREGFLKSLTDELAELGWIFIKLDDQFAIIDSNKLSLG